MVTLLAQTSTDPTVSIFVLLVLLVFLALIPANIASRKGHSALAFYIFGFLFFLPALIVTLVMRPKSRPAASWNAVPSGNFGIAWMETGTRYLLGYAMEDPYYGIWDSVEPGPAVARFPYTEHGKAEAMVRFHQLEPQSHDLIQIPEAMPAPPPMPGG